MTATLHARVLPTLRFLPIQKDAFRMLTVAYGKVTLDRSNVYRWYQIFSEVLENDVNDEDMKAKAQSSQCGTNHKA